MRIIFLHLKEELVRNKMENCMNTKINFRLTVDQFSKNLYFVQTFYYCIFILLDKSLKNKFEYYVFIIIMCVYYFKCTVFF